MKQKLAFNEQLKKAGATKDMMELYQRYLETGNKQGQERVLCKCRRMKDDLLKENQAKLACLDYIIARVENTQEIFEKTLINL